MNANANDSLGEQPRVDQRAALPARLRAALGMEDEISSGVYEDYLNRQHWPGQPDDVTLAEIKQRLAVLIEDTNKHKKILQALVREHGSDK